MNSYVIFSYDLYTFFTSTKFPITIIHVASSSYMYIQKIARSMYNLDWWWWFAKTPKPLVKKIRVFCPKKVNQPTVTGTRRNPIFHCFLSLLSLLLLQISNDDGSGLYVVSKSSLPCFCFYSSRVQWAILAGRTWESEF